MPSSWSRTGTFPDRPSAASARSLPTKALRTLGLRAASCTSIIGVYGHAVTDDVITLDDVRHGFDCADSETPAFAPGNTPLALAARCFFKSMQRDIRPWGACHGGSIDLEPLHYDALPLVNGCVMGEADDPRLG